MRVQFLWRDDEWRRAHRLGSAKAAAGTGTSMNLLVVAVLALGGAGDMAYNLGTDRSWSLQGTLLPVLLAGAALTSLLLYALDRHRGLRERPPMPAGEQCLVLQETGWSLSDEAGGPMRLAPWSSLRGYREGRGILVLFPEEGGMVAVPLRAFAEDEAEWVQRLLARKTKAARSRVRAALLDHAA